MGYKLVGPALEAKIPESKNPATGLVKVVLIALLDRACNETFECYPSMKDLHKRSQVSLSSVKRSIYLLEKYGYITIKRRRVEGKEANTSNYYKVNLDNLINGVAKVEENLGSRRTDPKFKESRPSVQGEPKGRVEERHKPVNEPVNEPVIKPVSKKPPKNRSLKTISDDFEITPKMKDWFSKKSFEFSIDDETQRFINHHIAKGSKFVEPERAWQNWMTGKFTPNNKSKVKPENFSQKNYGESTFKG